MVQADYAKGIFLICSDFASSNENQAFYERCILIARGDIHWLDDDGNGKLVKLSPKKFLGYNFTAGCPPQPVKKPIARWASIVNLRIDPGQSRASGPGHE